jgi:hypothetical protein
MRDQIWAIIKRSFEQGEYLTWKQMAMELGVCSSSHLARFAQGGAQPLDLRPELLCALRDELDQLIKKVL